MFSICQCLRALTQVGMLWTYAHSFDPFSRGPLLKQSLLSPCCGSTTPSLHAANLSSNQAILVFFLLVICTSGVLCIWENVNISYWYPTQHAPSWLLLCAVHCCRVKLTWKGQLEISTSSYELKNGKISRKNATFPDLTFCMNKGPKNKIRFHLYPFIQRYYWQNSNTQQV